jgi:hypothetical protein
MPLSPEFTEFWTLNHSGDAVRCVAARHPLGVELRYVMNDRPLITRVFEDWQEVAGQAQIWREGLESKGWVVTRVALREALH